MAASKKTSPFSRLRYGRSRKNGPLTTDAKKAASVKSSVENDSSFSHKTYVYPPYFTVDDLATTRRKKIPGKQRPDNLRPLSGKFADYKSEYKKQFRSFVIPFEESSENLFIWKKKKTKMKEERLKPEGDIEFNVEYYDNFVEFPIQKVASIKPQDQLPPNESKEFYSSTENKEKYVMFKEARRATLTRHMTNLKMEGDFEDSTENKEKFVFPENALPRPELTRRNTTLKLEGELQFSTEINEKYKEFKDVPRTKLIRRYTVLEIPREKIKFGTEYRRSFVYPESVERVAMIRSAENLYVEGQMNFEPEYKENFIDFHAPYPDIKFRTRNRTECENRSVTTITDKVPDTPVKDIVREGTPKRNFSPVPRPTFRRTSSSLVPSAGIEETESELRAKYTPFKIEQRTKMLRPSTHLKPEGRIDLYPEYRTSFTDFYGEKNYNRKLPPNGCNKNTACCVEDRLRNSPEPKSFSVLKNIPDDQNVNCCSSRINRSGDKRFQKGKRYPVCNDKRYNEFSTAETFESETINAARPPFRLEVTNPDVIQKPFNKFKQERSFVILDENNSENQWLKNKQKKSENRRWSPSWMNG